MLQDARLGWTLAAVFAVVAVVLAGFLWYEMDRRAHDMAFILEEGKDRITDARAELARECEGSDVDQASCQAALDELADILRDFSRNIEDARTGAGAGTPAGPHVNEEAGLEAETTTQ